MNRQTDEITNLRKQIESLENRIQNEDLNKQEEKQLKEEIDRLEGEIIDIVQPNSKQNVHSPPRKTETRTKTVSPRESEPTQEYENSTDINHQAIIFTQKEIERKIYRLNLELNERGLDWSKFAEIHEKIAHWNEVLSRIESNSIKEKDLNELTKKPKPNSIISSSEKKTIIHNFSIDTRFKQSDLVLDVKFNKREFQAILNTKEENEEKLLWQLINTFLTNGSLLSCYIVNKSLNSFFTYSVRPIETHKLLKDRDLSLAFDFKFNLLKDYRMHLIRINPTYNQPKRQFELEAQLQVFLDNKMTTLGRNDRDLLQTKVCSQVLDVKKKLEEWQQYLSWKKEEIEKRQFWMRFNKLSIDADLKTIQIHIPVSSDQDQQKITKINRMIEEEILLADFSQSKTKDQWKPKNYPEFYEIGVLVRTQIQKKTQNESRNNNSDNNVRNNNNNYTRNPSRKNKIDSEDTISDENCDSVLILSIDYSALEEGVNFEEIPKTGFILNSLIGDMHTILIQQKGIERLQNLEAVNNHLSDFIFDSTGAQLPKPQKDVPMEFLRKDLNEDQKSAIRKAIAAPDLFLMQGPPGTGKTTTIAEICNYYCAQTPSKRILLASQSNLAVDNALICLIEKNYIYPMRIGSRATEFGEKFLKKNVLQSWIQKTYNQCNELFQPHAKVAENIHQFEKVLQNLPRLLPIINANLMKSKKIQSKIKKLEKELAKEQQNLQKSQDAKTKGDGLENNSLETTELETNLQKITTQLEENRSEFSSIEHHDQEFELAWLNELKSIEPIINGEKELTNSPISPTSPPSFDINSPPALNTIEFLTNFAQTYKESHQDSLQYYQTKGQIQKQLLEKYQLLLNNDKNTNFPGIKELEEVYEANVNILGLTCAESGKKKYYAESFKPFDVVIVDEVSRATPPELLLPLLLGKKIILIGDHKQLPPIFKEKRQEEFEEKNAETEGLLKKFERMFTAMLFNDLYINANLSLKEQLITQYRFHPQIMQLVNMFYQEKPLVCGLKDPDNERAHNLTIPNVLTPNNHAMWIDSSKDQLGNITHEDYDRTSAYNEFEIEIIRSLILQLNEQLQKQGFGVDNPKKIGIITFYRAQMKRIRWMIDGIRRENKTALECLDLKCNTVDRFQGMEREIILVSFVRTNRNVQEFVRNYHRINVAISRARQLLIIIGNADAYSRYEVEVINSAGIKENQRVYEKMIHMIKQNDGFISPLNMNFPPHSVKDSNQYLKSNNRMNQQERRDIK